MNYINGFRQMAAANHYRASLVRHGRHLARQGRHLHLMEVCGSHTMAIARFGIRDFLPDNITLISGPGCPVCVTVPGVIDAAIDLAAQGKIIATFGDMLRVPGSSTTLDQARSQGGRVEICYSPQHAVELARNHRPTEVVFLAIGFETTVAPIMAALDGVIREAIGNFSLLTAFKQVPPALSALIADPEMTIDGLLCPAHVSAIIGADAYLPYATNHGMACVVAGFEPLDILHGLEGLAEQWVTNHPHVDNQYNRVVKPSGNRQAQRIMERYLLAVDAEWRGLGTIPSSGLALRPEFHRYDASHRFALAVEPGHSHPHCLCGEVLKGKMTPKRCLLFGRGCHPDHPLGPCMVSSEGSCAAEFKYASGVLS
ncbi:MAG: hydrogenase formation protein HypD [Magnetococcales bacterium]|nr:hydrogenase formation protein HypD [Magnetococcales bacterium]